MNKVSVLVGLLALVSCNDSHDCHSWGWGNYNPYLGPTGTPIPNDTYYDGPKFSNPEQPATHEDSVQAVTDYLHKYGC